MSKFELVTVNDDNMKKDIALRDLILEQSIEQAIGPYKPFVRKIGKSWKEFNKLYFDNKLTSAFIGITLPTSRHAWADASKYSMYGGGPQIRLLPTMIDGTHKKFNPNHQIENRWLFIRDVLLHEMIHQYQYEILGMDNPKKEDGYQGHGVEFTQKANEISDALGLPHVVERRRKDKSLPISSQWPENVRPEGYYGDLFKVVEPKEPEPETEDEPEDDELSPLDVAITAYANLTEHDRGLFHNAMDLIEKSKIPAAVTVNDDKSNVNDLHKQMAGTLQKLIYLKSKIAQVYRGEASIIMYDDDDEIYFETKQQV